MNVIMEWIDNAVGALITCLAFAIALPVVGFIVTRRLLREVIL